MNNYNCEIAADSLNTFGNRITTFKLTYPRIIHSELMTHRVFSRNAASSRAVPVKKMIESVRNNMFTPLAVQKAHKGMQGSDYFEGVELEQAKQLWIESAELALQQAEKMEKFGITKQLINRILEPYQYYQVLVTATEYDGFFALRCPQYSFGKNTDNPKLWKSRKDAIKDFPDWETRNDFFWSSINNSQAEIHMQALAEAMYDAYNESTPKELKPEEWHIPFGDNIDITTKSKIVSQENNRLIEKYDNPMSFSLPTIDLRDLIEPLKVKISTARCARLSYMTFDGKIDYEKDIELHDKLLISKHASPFEHCCRAMTDLEYHTFIKGKIEEDESKNNPDIYGWSDNLRGFISYRHLIENM